jgi:WD40 repeat protein
LATATGEGRIEFWDLASGALLSRVFVGDSPFHRKLAFSPDGRYFAAIGGDEVKLFEVRGLSDESLRSTLGHYSWEVLSAELSPCQPAMACVGTLRQDLPKLPPLQQGTVRHYDLSPARRHSVWKIPVHAGGNVALLFHPSEPYLMAAVRGQGLLPCYRFHLGTRQGEQAGRFRHPVDMRFSRTGDRVFAIDRVALSATEWQNGRARGAHEICSWKWPALWEDWFRFDNSGAAALYGRKNLHEIAVGTRYLVAGAGSGQLLLFDIDKSAQTATTDAAPLERHVLPNVAPLREIHLPTEVLSVALSSDESVAVAGLADGTVRMFRLPELQTMGIFREHMAAVTSVRFSPVDSTLATGSDDHTVRLWQRRGENLEPLLVLDHGGAIRSVSIGDNGALLSILVSMERAVRVCRLDRLRAELNKLQVGW